MIRKLKVIGLAFVAVLAMSAVAAPASQAAPEFTCSPYPCTATGSSAKGAEEFTTEAGTVKCNSHFLVEKVGGGDLTGPSQKVTVTPTYTNCEAFGFLSATVNVEECDYVFTATEKLGPDHYVHHVDIVCPTGQSIKITAGTCKAEVKGQTGVTDVTTLNTKEGVTVEPTAEVALVVTQDGFGCPFLGTGNKTGNYHGDVHITRVGGGLVSVSGE